MELLSGFVECTDCPIHLREVLYCDHCPNRPRCTRCAIKHAKYLKLHHQDVPQMLRRPS